MERITLTVNGVRRELEIEPRRLLVHVLREDLGLTGTHIGCDTTQCGACTVHLDGLAVKSCTVLACLADGAVIKTIEGVASGAELHPLQWRFKSEHGLQCGFCTPGMIMAGLQILERYPAADAAKIRHELDGNICRCTGYDGIVRAILAAAQDLKSGAPAVHSPRDGLLPENAPRQVVPSEKEA